MPKDIKHYKKTNKSTSQ